MTAADRSAKDGNHYVGVIHIHSAYSHDGHDRLATMSSRLKEDGIDFCIVTDHFRDFDEAAFERYLEELREANSLRQTLLVPGIEAELGAFHVILLPVSSYQQVAAIQETGGGGDDSVLRFLAHPGKYPMPAVRELLGSLRLDGMEVWNQQADGNHFPPVRLLRQLIPALPTGLALFFGTDIHNIEYRANNLLIVPADAPLTAEHVVGKLRNREFSNRSRLLAHPLPAASSVSDLSVWIAEVEKNPHLVASVLYRVRRLLKLFYDLLPKSTRVAVNDVKNAIRSRL